MQNRRRGHKREEGTVAIMVAIMLVVLIGFAAFTVDIGQMFRVRNELQNTSDSAALAAAQFLDGTPAGITKAFDAANDPSAGYAEKHQANNAPVLNTHVEVEFGRYYFVEANGNLCSPAPCFAKFDDPNANAAAVNSVRVRSKRVDATDNSSVRHFFAPLIGRSKTAVIADAVAVGGGPFKAECGFPMVVPDCVIEAGIAGGTCDYCMKFQDNNTDNAGWTSFGSGPVNGGVLYGLIAQACLDANGVVAVDETTNECQGLCNVPTTVGTEVKVQNGNLMNPGQGSGNFCALIQEILTRQGTVDPPQPFTVRVPVLASEDSVACDASQFSSFKIIEGYATMVIHGAACANNDAGVYAPSAPNCSLYKDPGQWPPPSGKSIVAELRCDLDLNEPAGGGNFGTDTPRVRLVE